MNDAKNRWKELVFRALDAVRREKGIPEEAFADLPLAAETPPNPELGDIGFPMFPYAKILRTSPVQIAQATAATIIGDPKATGIGTVRAEGPYVNITLNRPTVAEEVLDAVLRDPDRYGRNETLTGRKIMVEFSSPNTNKPLHLGHLRNDALGESVSRILAANGAEVFKIDLINDRGVHICKSMLAYMAYGQGCTPESEGIKSDHFVGDYYVRFNDLKKQDPSAEERAQALLVKWEAGDPETLSLWKTMNQWAEGGIKQTYQRTGISFDKYYHESQIYVTGKDEVLRGLETGAFFKAEDGSVRVDLSDIGLDAKVLLRKDGTSIYMTQDIGLAIERHRDWPFDQLIYVVASEQQYHFRVLFHILARLGYSWARNLYHLSYGLVNLPEGRMKTREGTVVDADTLLDSLRELAVEEIASKGREDAVGDISETAEKIALGAVHFYLLQATPSKDMIFNPKESLSFNGATGPYIQYMGARISSLLRKHEEGEGNARGGTLRPELLIGDAEWALVRGISEFPEAVARAARDLDPSAVATCLYDLASAFSRFYHDNPILTAPDKDTAASRLALARAARAVLQNGLELVCIPFLETM